MDSQSKPWNDTEIEKLRTLHIDPVKTDRNTLSWLIKYFKGEGRKRPGGIWGVTDGYSEEVHISRELAKKIRNLVKTGDLDWILTNDVGGQSNRLQIRGLTPAECEKLDNHWKEIKDLAGEIADEFSHPPLQVLYDAVFAAEDLEPGVHILHVPRLFFQWNVV